MDNEEDTFNVLKRISKQEMLARIREPMPKGMTVTEFTNRQLENSGWTMEELFPMAEELAKNAAPIPNPKYISPLAKRMRKLNLVPSDMDWELQQKNTP